MTAVFGYLDRDGVLVFAGTAYFTLRRGKLSTTFTYGQDYLGSAGAYAIDPELPLESGNRTVLHSLPGTFADAAPDRWGRNLIAKRIQGLAAQEGHPLPAISDLDYLLGVSDVTRQGALRFAFEPGGEFQHPEAGVPKLLALPKLMRAAERVAWSGTDDMAAIKALLDAGTGSLGGARPKASVHDGDKLLIAKFPHHGDEWSVIRWEKTALDLAELAGIIVPLNRMVEIEGQAVLLLERFDRVGAQRIGYMSAMTLIEAEDGVTRDYVEIAEALAGVGSDTAADLRQLWRRIAFSIAIHNTDDHLRNHGFLRRGSGWQLSPAFDINPNPVLGTVRATSVGGASDPAAEVSALLAYADVFGLTPGDAAGVLRDVASALRQWPEVARRNGIDEKEIRLFAPTLDSTITAVGDGAV
jgi:serine/threonine-protein kinase HipA